MEVGFAIENGAEVVSVPVGKLAVLKITVVLPNVFSSGINSLTFINLSPVPICRAPDSAKGVAESYANPVSCS